MATRSRISARGAAAWAVTLLVGAFVVRNFEHVMEERDWHRLGNSLIDGVKDSDWSLLSSTITSVMISDFMLGFASAAFIFGVWDVAARWRRDRMPKQSTDCNESDTTIRGGEEKRQIIDDAYRMIDRIEKLYHTGDATGRITDVIRLTREYQRIRPHLNQTTRDLINMSPQEALVLRTGTLEDHVIERLREDIADVERRWGLA